MATAATFSTAQLCVLRSLKKGWSGELLDYLLSRNGAAWEEWLALRGAGLIEMQDGRWVLTKLGRRTYNRESVGRMF